MSTSGIIRKFERFLESIPNERAQTPILNKPKIIGYITYDFKNKTETYTPIKEDNPDNNSQ